MKTFMASPATIDRKWYVVDAEGKTLGRLASEVAKVLRGKNKAIFTPHIDTGDYVIVVNADKVKVTGKKFRPEDLLSSLRLYRWYERDNIKRDDEQAPRARYRVRCKGECFQRDLLDVRCIQSYSYTLDQITNMQLRSLRH